MKQTSNVGLIVGSFLLVTFPAVMTVVLWPAIEYVIFTPLKERDVEKANGFLLDRQRVVSWNLTLPVFADIRPGGAADRAGVRVGDVPCGDFHHGNDSFLWHFKANDPTPRVVVICTPPDRERRNVVFSLATLTAAEQAAILSEYERQHDGAAGFYLIPEQTVRSTLCP